MMKIGFDNQKYIKLQSENINKRVAQFNKLYLEFGGKLLMTIMLQEFCQDLNRIPRLKCCLI